MPASRRLSAHLSPLDFWPVRVLELAVFLDVLAVGEA